MYRLIIFYKYKDNKIKTKSNLPNAFFRQNVLLENTFEISDWSKISDFGLSFVVISLQTVTCP